jgi:pimeloyl-ACP methyl ester carboxylesterase
MKQRPHHHGKDHGRIRVGSPLTPGHSATDQRRSRAFDSLFEAALGERGDVRAGRGRKGRLHQGAARGGLHGVAEVGHERLQVALERAGVDEGELEVLPNPVERGGDEGIAGAEAAVDAGLVELRRLGHAFDAEALHPVFGELGHGVPENFGLDRGPARAPSVAPRRGPGRLLVRAFLRGRHAWSLPPAAARDSATPRPVRRRRRRLAPGLVALLVGVVASGCMTTRVTWQSRTGCAPPGEVLTTEAGIAFVRTPDACFADLPDWPYAPQYVELDGLRQAYVDVGPRDGLAIVLLHGQPSWSYLYRHMIPSLVDAGMRVIAMDHLGMGRSDKPVDLAAHSFAQHADRLERFLDALDLQQPALFAQDWGSIIGLYVAAGDLERFGAIIVGNGGLPVVTQRSTPPTDVEDSNDDFHRMLTLVPDRQPPFFNDDGSSRLPVPDDVDPGAMFGQWSTYARTDDRFVPSLMLEALTYEALDPQERYAYDAPFVDRSMMAAPRTFPSLRDELIGITEERLDALTRYERPFLTLFGGNDPGLAGEGDAQAWMSTKIPGAVGQPHHRYPDASHFLQDDQGPDIAARVVAFLQSHQLLAPPAAGP